MASLVAKESSRPGWDGPVVDLLEEDAVVGCAFLDDDQLFVEFYADDDGDPWVYDVADLQRVLDIAAAMLGAVEVDAAARPDSGVDPIDHLASEFDATAAHRGPEDEGFYPLAVSRRIVAASEALDLAVTSVEGFEARGSDVMRLTGYAAAIGSAHEGEPWALFRAGCNIQAAAILEKWASSGELLIAIEVIDRDGEEYVL